MTTTTCRTHDNWKALLAHRLDAELPEPVELDRALAHLAGCDPCRQRALAEDPSLVFHPAVFRPAAEPAGTDMAAEVTAMQRAVRTMRRAERVESASAQAQVAGGSRGGWRRFVGGVTPGAAGRWAAALVAATAALLLGAGAWVGPPGTQLAFEAAGSAPPSPIATSESATFGPAVEDVLSAMPLIETTEGSVNDDPPLIFEGQETALIWVWDSDVPKDV